MKNMTSVQLQTEINECLLRAMGNNVPQSGATRMTKKQITEFQVVMRDKDEGALKKEEQKALTLLNNEYKNMERRKITKGKMVKGFKAKLLGMAAKLGVTGKNKTIIIITGRCNECPLLNQTPKN